MTMFVKTQAVQLPLGTGRLLSSQLQLIRSSELCRNRLPSKSSGSSSVSHRTRPGPVYGNVSSQLVFTGGYISYVLLALPQL